MRLEVFVMAVSPVECTVASEEMVRNSIIQEFCHDVAMKTKTISKKTFKENASELLSRKKPTKALIVHEKETQQAVCRSKR